MLPIGSASGIVGKIGLNVGSDYVGRLEYSLAQESPVLGKITAKGLLYSRETYSKIFSYMDSHPDLVLSEDDWQAYKLNSPDLVPFYSTGDGTTSFRTPELSGLIEGSGTWLITAFTIVTNNVPLELSQIYSDLEVIRSQVNSERESLGYRVENMQVNVGDIKYLYGSKYAGLIVRYTQSGITASSLPTEISLGTETNDGTAKFIAYRLPITVNGEEADSSGNISVTIPEQVNADWNATQGAAKILNKPLLSLVATSGSYNDLSNKPLLSSVATSGSYNDLSNKPPIPTITIATQSEAEAGTNNSKHMTPLRTKQAITKNLNNVSSLSMSFTGSTQKAITFTAAGTGSATSVSLYTSVGVKAGTYTLKSLLQTLINISHSHSNSTANCNCNCNCDCGTDS